MMSVIYADCHGEVSYALVLTWSVLFLKNDIIKPIMFIDVTLSVIMLSGIIPDCI